MNYRDICINNQYLFGLFEQLSAEIAWCTIKNLADEAQHLQRHKDAVKELIDINLDKMEDIWETMSLKRPAERKPMQLKPTKVEEMIIMSYLFNEDKRETTIATKLHVKINDVKKTINKYLQGDYILQVA